MPLIKGRPCRFDEDRGCYVGQRPLAVNRKDGSVMVYVPAGTLLKA